MKKVLLSLLISSSCFAQVFETVPLLQSGDNSKRVIIAVLGDGFTAAQQTAFTTSAQATINYLFTKSPYTEYKNYFNAYAVKVVSTESGVKHPGTATDVTEPVIPVSNPNNYLGSSFDVGVHRCIYSNTTNKVGQVLAANVPDYDITYVLGNSTEYGGCGGAYAFASLNNSSNEIVVHELGHSFGKLADEYWFAGTGESANKTQNSNPATIKWKNWVGVNNVGIYSHAESPTWFRPHQSCEMRYLNQQFCSVCKEAIIEKIHSLVSPVDSFVPANNTSVDAAADVTFTVNEILPVPNTLINSWTLNGTALAATGNSVTISPSQLNTGNNTLNFSVVDDNPLLKVDNHSTLHVTNVSWTLNKSTLKLSEVKAEERRFSIYPNPTIGEFYVKGKKDFSKDVKVEIYDASGKLIPGRFDLKDPAAIRVDIKDFPSGTYLLNVIENKNLIISQKIIKE
ncbi:T9SS type A sorting domain-containing protein [Chryseobacterium sp. Tr-659]|uniref:T9SS type A sorting domain-containing protein n=1 Tax=Chryseobacterium sp. Tr-659 TaxID=2608340 RepID=UPI00142455AF|nr:M64 family metallopeptidase [Chryseobacterium sp. Tr-659]NIF07880.1 T9SS type A sorting domain-containing protein [Chryseobacterium sp. Tr-659]